MGFVRNLRHAEATASRRIVHSVTSVSVAMFLERAVVAGRASDPDLNPRRLGLGDPSLKRTELDLLSKSSAFTVTQAISRQRQQAMLKANRIPTMQLRQFPLEKNIRGRWFNGRCNEVCAQVGTTLPIHRLSR